jgi:hypothetical protein
MRASEVRFVEDYGTGRGFSEKFRSFIHLARNQVSKLAEYDEEGALITSQNNAICLFTITADGQRIWSEALPFQYDKKHGHRNLADAARQSGMLVQIVDDPESGLYAVWVAPKAEVRSCAQCKQRMVDFVKKEMKSDA